MPRAKSGNPPWELIAVKLPPPTMQALRRFAQQAHLSVSDLLREAVALRLASAPPAPPAPTAPGLVPAAEAVPLFDAKKHVLGSLCKRGHNYEGTGQSLKYFAGGCVACDRERQRRKP